MFAKKSETIAEITAPIGEIVRKLRNLSEAKIQSAEMKKQESDRLEEEAMMDQGEAAKATSLAEKYETLLT